MVDAIFTDRRLAEIYDVMHGDRADLTPYLTLTADLGARSVLDIGCGTGIFALRLAARGMTVIGIDPASASLQVARTKPGAERVRWLLGEATALPAIQVDLAVMTANVAQVFLTDDDWLSTLRSAHTALRPGGHLVFETRDPARRAWLDWNPEQSRQQLHLANGEIVQAWSEVTDVSGELVSFRWSFQFESGGQLLTSDSTLRFRSGAAMAQSLEQVGFRVLEIRDAADRPGRELVFVAGKPDDDRGAHPAAG